MLRTRVVNWYLGWRSLDTEGLSKEIESVRNKLYDSAAFSGRILKMTQREVKALAHVNMIVKDDSHGRATLHDFIAHIEGEGLRILQRAY